ncbi:MAG: helix-turn-helix transcriptional regulator [Herbiconiux sp.]|nr:helix-turn-helix transcriptional regulator [Herbiconiux sp.]
MSQPPRRSTPVEPTGTSRDSRGADAAAVGAQPEPLWRQLVGEQLREVRQSRGESLRGVARRASVSPQYLSEVERGFKEPSSELLAAIAGALDRTLLDLATGVAERLSTGASRDSGLDRTTPALAARASARVLALAA